MIDQLKYHDGELEHIPEIPEELKAKYQTAFGVSHEYIVEAAAHRQKWIDQSQSVNLFLAEPNIVEMSKMYIAAWRKGLKTTYYLRTQSASNIEKSTLKKTDHSARSLHQHQPQRLVPSTTLNVKLANNLDPNLGL